MLTLAFWKSLCGHLKINASFFTAFHPQTDSQTERVNAMMEQYLWAYINYQQDDWTNLLYLAEFAHNNLDIELLGVSLCKANYGFHPDFVVSKASRPKTKATTSQEVQYFIDKLYNLHEALK